MNHALGIDIGTSGCRGCVLDESGRELATARVTLAAPRRSGHEAEQDPALWWEALTGLLDQLATGPALASVRALCLDGTSATLLGCDQLGTPVTPALMYNDARAREQAGRIAAVAPADSGALGASSSLAKLLWLKDSGYAQLIHHALHQADWLLGRLCGRFDVSDENNALKLGYDCSLRHWPDWLHRLGLPEHWLPSVVPPGTPIGRVLPEWCVRWGLPPQARVLSGTTDSTAAFIATGAGPGVAVTTLGSTLVLKLLADHPVFSAAHGVYSHRIGDHWLVGGASNSGGAVLEQLFTAEEITRYTAWLDPDAPTGLDYYPLPARGERFPASDPALEPRLTPRPEDRARFFQAILEGIAQIEASGYNKLAELGAPRPQHVLTSGGGARNAPWMKIRARLLGVPVTAAAHTEAAYGAALLALRNLQAP